MAILHLRKGGTQALETSCIWLLTAFRPHGIIYVSGAAMNLRQITLAAVLLGVSGAAGLPQAPQAPLIDPKAAPAEQGASRAQPCYNFALAHTSEQQHEATSSAAHATNAIE